MSENIQNTETIENQVVAVEKTDSNYAPSSVEKKRAVMMYFLFGIIISISKKQVNSFEYFHLKQSIGWWLCFLLILIVSIILMLIPGLKYIGFLALMAMVVCLGIFAKQARDGKYHVDMKKYVIFGVFPSLGTWLVDLFEVSPKETSENQTIPDIAQAAENLPPQDVVSQPEIPEVSTPDVVPSPTIENKPPQNI